MSIHVSIPPAGRDYLTELREQLSWSEDRVAYLEGLIEYMRNFHPQEVEDCARAYAKVANAPICGQSKEGN